MQDGATLAGEINAHSEAVVCCKSGWFSRVLSFFRGARVATADELGAD
jgi:hypothetical protein